MTGDTSNRELLVRSRWFLLAVALVVILVLSISYWLVDPSLPSIGRELKLFAIAFVVGSILAAAPATKLVDWLHTPDSKYLVEYDAETDEFELWEIPAPQWRSLEIEDELHQLNASEPVYEVNDYDPDEQVATGVWRGSASDLELIQHREAVAEVRGDLEDLAREGLAIRAKQSSIVRGAVADIVMEFVADFEEESTYSGTQIQQRVDSALDELDEEPSDPDDDQDDEDDPLLDSFAQTSDRPDSDTEPNKNGNK
ncbi:hypothetical protein [Halovenus sp. HT40]|uniref:hypothetical protein n=1 Tax=Halovenus sp. HT40 TaxID=3126691 RepID=UPI00300EB6A5